MRLGDHPELYGAIMDALQDVPWAFGVTVWASESPAGYRVTLAAGGRFLTHHRTIVIPVSDGRLRNLAHHVKGKIEEMRLELDRVASAVRP